MKCYKPHVAPYSNSTTFEVDAHGAWVKHEDVLQFKAELLEIIADAKVTTEMKLKYLELHIRMCSA